MSDKKHISEFVFISILILVYLFITLYLLKPAYQDDAYITFIYAQNLSRGRGLVYNQGEYVEGFSSPLYTLLLGIFNWILSIDIPLLSIILSVISGSLAILLTFLIISKHINDPGLQAFFCMFVLVAFTPFLVESMQGMETAMYILLITAFIYSESICIKGRIFLIIYPLIILTRPEGLFLITGYCLFRLIFLRDKAYLPKFLYSLFFYILVVLIRYSYYGDIFPNTFYAKTPFSLAMLKEGINSNLIFFRKLSVLLVPVILFALLKWKRILKDYFIFIYPLIFYISFNTYIGGGFKFTHRYDIFPLSSYIILFSLSVITAAKYLKYKHLRHLLVFAFSLFTLLYNYSSFSRATGFHEARKTIIYRQYQFALYLKDAYPPETVISTGQAGAIKYFTGFTNIDMLGLCDRHIARGEFDTRGLNLAGHLKGDGNYILARNPDIILFHNGLFSKELLSSDIIRERTLSQMRFSGWLSEIEMMQSDIFWEKYEFKSVQLSDFYAHYYKKRLD